MGEKRLVPFKFSVFLLFRIFSQFYAFTLITFKAVIYKSKCKHSTEDLDTPIKMTRTTCSHCPRPAQNTSCQERALRGVSAHDLARALPPQLRGSNIDCPQAPVGDNIDQETG